MATADEIFIKRVGLPESSIPHCISFNEPFDQMLWKTIYEKIGAGWYKNRFYYLFGEKLDELTSIIAYWDFLLPPEKTFKIIGTNAFGSLLLIADMHMRGTASQIYVIDPTIPYLWTDEHCVFMNFIGHWLPENKVGSFCNSKLYESFMSDRDNPIKFGEIVTLKTNTEHHGGIIDRSNNLQLDSIDNYHKNVAYLYKQKMND